MGGVYRRGNKLSVWWFTGKLDEKTGKPERDWKATGLPVGQEKEAKRVLASIEKKVAREMATGIPEGDLTVKANGEMWLKAREAAGKDGWKDDAHHLRLHVFPLIGRMLIKEVLTRHIRDVVSKLPKRISRRGTPLSPRTVNNIYGSLRTMFHDAVVDGEISVNPCVLKEGDLPDRLDQDPLWRNTAIFTRSEVELIISDARIPEDRRVFYALAFLTGMRFGEISALRWSVYDPLAEPLGKLHVAISFDSAKKKVEPVKSGVPRNIPVHTALAKVLGKWKLGGFERFMGRKPGPDDLIVPTEKNRHRRNTRMLKLFNQDLAMLGLRPRRQHDARRAFITFGRSDCTRDHIFKWISHGPSKKMLDVYSTFPWATICEEIMPLKLRLLEGKVLPMVAVSGAPEAPLQVGDFNGNVTAPCDSPCDSGKQKMEKRGEIMNLEAKSKARSTGLETVPGVSSTLVETNSSEENQLVTSVASRPEKPFSIGTVTLSHGKRRDIGAVLRGAAAAWEDSPDVERLHGSLTCILDVLANVRRLP